MKKETKILSIKVFAFLASIFYFLSLSCYAKGFVTFVKKGAIMPYGKNYYIVSAPIVANIENFRQISVPVGFKTDLASVPRIFWNVFPPDRASYMYPAILHDYLYESDFLKSRKKADEIFYYSLINQGVSKKTAYTMYAMVRIFGFFHYKKVKKK